MRRVRPRTAGPEDATHTPSSPVLRAVAAYRNATATRIRQAGEMYEVSYSTIRGRLQGRKRRHEAHIQEQILTPTEEKSLVKWVMYLAGKGFPPRVEMVTYMALKILKARDGASELGVHW